MRKRLGLLGITVLMSTLPVDVAAAAPTLDWQPCPDVAPWLECAKLPVPLDYSDPGRGTIDLAVSRVKSPNPKARRGALLLNPGGPGGSGLDMPATVQELAPVRLTDAYDLIGFDPRGTGASSPVTCELTPEQSYSDRMSPYPAADGDITANVAYAKQVAKQCGAHSGQVLPYITTLNTARDMDRIRVALGEKRISYFGVSYGSYLGAVYTNLFPAQSDRIVLDSVVDPRDVWRSVWRRWGPATEERFGDFANWAALRDGTYRLGSTPAAVRAKVLALAEKLDASPQGAETGNWFREWLRGELYDDKNFPGLANNLVRKTQPAILTGAAVEPTQSNAATRWGVVCGDAAWPALSVEQYERQVREDIRSYPLTHGMPSNIWPCAFWPTRPVEPPAKITDRGPANVLLTQNRRDPATPRAGAEAMRAALGDRARLVTADQGGHGAYIYTDNACVSNAATLFLLGGALPARDIACDAHQGASGDSLERDRARLKLRSHQLP